MDDVAETCSAGGDAACQFVGESKIGSITGSSSGIHTIGAATSLTTVRIDRFPKWSNLAFDFIDVLFDIGEVLVE